MSSWQRRLAIKIGGISGMLNPRAADLELQVSTAVSLHSLLTLCGSGGFHRGGSFRGRRQAERLTHFSVKLLAHVNVIAQELPGVFAALPDALTSVGKPRPTFFEDITLGGYVDQITFF
jgi:hypothetical protein